ncbi:putative AGPT-Pplase3 domain-containing protein [Pseudomonas sp. IT-P74]|uniref:hypothetical protein n=1 Tax=Pseudomonas sp. IT-P74 TaxID=3026445 RepID=UPI0039E1D583
MTVKTSSSDKETRLFRNRLRTKALLNELSLRVGMPFADTFAKWFDQEMITKGLYNRANTAESNRWAGSFKGRTALQNEQLDLLHELFSDAQDLYHNGPSNLWEALWGEPDQLWKLCKTRVDANAHFMDDKSWNEALSKHDNQYDICEALRVFEGEIMLATETDFHDLPFGCFIEAVALYRLHTHAISLFKINSDGIGAYRSLFQCISNGDIKIRLLLLGVYLDIKKELIRMETIKLQSYPDYCEKAGLRYPPSDDAARKYASDPLAIHPNSKRWDDLKFDWVSSDA